MELQRTHHEVEAGRRESKILERGLNVADARVSGILARLRQHPGREVDADHARSALVDCVTAHFAEAAAEIEHALVRQRRQQRAHRRLIDGSIETALVAAQLAVALEEFLIVVNILLHQTRTKLRKASGRGTPDMASCATRTRWSIPAPSR